ncbi:MAG: hypothetical protein IKT44_01810 [Clostridia bacterium]|nr:hypothetical protein [Clostridia bacterium]
MKKLLALGLLLTLPFSFSACGGNTVNNEQSKTTNTSNCPASQYGNHDWNRATCQEPQKCEECNAYKNDELGTHYWSDATCQRPSKCADCGTYKDDKLGTHNFLSDGECVHCGIKYEDYINSKE